MKNEVSKTFIGLRVPGPLGDRRRDLGANGKIQKQQEQTEAQPDGA
jgi:hypothetical protein